MIIATQSASAEARSSFHSIHFAKRQTISPALDAAGSTICTSPKEPSFVTWWSMQMHLSPLATGSTSGGMRLNELQSTAIKRSKAPPRRRRAPFSLRTGIKSVAPSRKPGFPSALRSAVAHASFPALLKSRARAIIEPSESPSGLRCPEMRIRFAPSISFFAAS